MAGRWRGKVDVFRIETFVHAPASVYGRDDRPTRSVICVRDGQQWKLHVSPYGGYNQDKNNYFLKLEAPKLPEGVKLKTRNYERWVDLHILWKEDVKAPLGAEAIRKKGSLQDYINVGVEVSLSYPVEKSPWKFASSDDVDRWDVAFDVKDQRYFAHRAILSAASSVFDTMFHGDFREKNELVIPVEEVEPEEFEMFLHCIYPCGVEPPDGALIALALLADRYAVKCLLRKFLDRLQEWGGASNIEKLHVAISTTDARLEAHVMASLTPADIVELNQSSVKNELGEARLLTIFAKFELFMRESAEKGLPKNNRDDYHDYYDDS